jgi:trigger factor
LNLADPQENPAESLEGQPAAADSQTTPVPPVPPEAEEEVIDINIACLREVEVEIPAEVVTREFDSVLQRYSKVARVAGFRKGKVPASIVRNRFTQEIKTDVMESLVPRYFRDAVVKEGFRPISEPRVHSLVDEPGQPIRFKAVFETMPEIPLGNYQEMKLDVPEVKVTDEDVEAELKRLQENQSSYDPVEEDRPLQDGDFAQITFSATPKKEETTAAAAEKPDQPKTETADAEKAPAANTEPDKPVQMDDVLVEIGPSDFSAHLRGAKTSEERDFEFTYPPDHEDKRIAGKTLLYKTKVNAIKKKTTPELTDDFARELSPDLQTLDDLKKRLREMMFAQRQHDAVQQGSDKLLNQLADTHDFPIPETFIQRQIDFRLEQWLRSLAAQGMRTEDMKRLDFKRLRTAQRDAATKEVKAHLLLEKIADAENLQATDEEVQRNVRMLAQQAKETPEAVERKLIENGGIDRIRKRIRSDKALRFLYDKSTSNARNGAIQE